MSVPASPSLRGWFVTFEGPDGSGKTIQADRLHRLALASGIPSTLTREPGGTAAGERVRELLLDAASAGLDLDPRADALLFSAARAQLVAEVIRPALARGELVVGARHADSTLAYQGYGAGLPAETLRAVQRFATDGLLPDLTILLDLPVEVGLGRKGPNERNRFEAGLDLDFHRRVRDGYLRMAAEEPDRWVMVDAGREADAVFTGVVAALERLPDLVAALARSEPKPPPQRMGR
jgi:dTMP kinase